VRVEDLHRIIRRGLFPAATWEPSAVFDTPARPLPLALEEGARERLLAAGRRLFGEKGYFETNIHQITSLAGLSVGAFYNYFPSKQAFYAELLRLVGREVWSFIASNLSLPERPQLNRLERELRGLWLWLIYLSRDRNCYAIVREAEFVLPAAVQDYYGAFVQGYRKNSEGNGEADEITAIEFLLGIAHYLGLETAFDGVPGSARTMVVVLARTGDEDPAGYIDGLLRTDGTQWNFIGVYAGGTRKPVTRELLDAGTWGLELLQRLPGDRNVKLWPPLVRRLLEKTGCTLAGVDHLIFTQINRSVIAAVMGELGLPLEKTTFVMDRYGYTGSACVPMALATAVREHRVHPGDTLVLVASGAGLAVGANLLVL
jgi:AcrR family transcriptional regulator